MIRLFDTTKRSTKTIGATNVASFAATAGAPDATMMSALSWTNSASNVGIALAALQDFGKIYVADGQNPNPTSLAGREARPPSYDSLIKTTSKF